MRPVLILAASALALAGTAGCQAQPAEDGGESIPATGQRSMVAELPAPSSIGARRSFSCRALMESEMTGSYDTTLTKGLEGRVSAGVNSVSIEIEDSRTLAFLSQAAFSAGTARGSSFEIVQDTQDQLVASFFNGSSVNTFVLNKSNGLAIWSKVRATFPVYGAPTGSQTYLICQ